MRPFFYIFAYQTINEESTVKKSRFILSALAVSVALCTAGCRGEDGGTTDPVDETPVTLFAALEQPDATRLSLLESGEAGVYDLVWSPSDAIALIGTEGGSPRTSSFTLSSGEGTTKGCFTGMLSASGEAPYYAVFPYQAGATLSEGSIAFSAPQRVPGETDNIAASALPAVASVATDAGGAHVALRNLFGLLKLTLSSATAVTVKKMTLHDLAGNPLWGECRVPIVAGEPDYANISISGGSNVLDLTWEESLTLNSTAKSFFFPVPPGALDRGFSLVIYERDLERPDSVGRAWSVIQKISSPVASVRSAIVEITPSAVSEKSEPLDVKARGYYKSLFVDGGMFLTSNDSTQNLPAIAYLGLENDYEYFGSSVNADLELESDSILNRSVQNGVMVSAPSGALVTWNDANGVLLYPDGSPRFRCIYANGGKSSRHGPTLTDQGRVQIHDFYMAGGGYVGTCAGAFLGSKYVDGTNHYDNATPSQNYSFGIWPGRVTHTHLPPNINTYPTVFTGMKVLSDMGALGYYGFAAGDTLEDTRHHGGCYLPHNAVNAAIPHEELLSFQYSDRHSAKDTSCYTAANTESMAKFRYGGNPIQLVDSVSTWAYKASSASGRAVLCGSHPEGRYCTSGKQRDYMAFMLRYAMDGGGDPVLKSGDLAMDAIRAMDRPTSAADPAHTRIGDRQYHHFRFVAAAPVEDFILTLNSIYDSASGINLWLTLRRGDFAWVSDADYLICTKGGQKSLRIKNLPAGTWYVGVYCATAVTATPTEVATTSSKMAFWNYSGKTEVLDGITYSLRLGHSLDGSIAPYSGISLSNDLDD